VSGSSLEVEVADGVATVTLGREPVNALDLDLYRGLADAFEALEDSGARAVVLRSSAGHFCAGADLDELSEETIRVRARLARRLFDTLRHHPFPVIAAVNGAALGAGAVIVACCDVRIGGASCRIGMPEISVGMLGGARHLMRIFPQGELRRLYYTGGFVDAETALRLGVLQAVVADGEEAREAAALASQIAEKDARALRLAKAAFNGVEELPVEEGYRIEQLLTRVLATSDFADPA
jgi:enoyl-CoA hydratase